MKRSDALKLIANQLDFLNGTFQGYRTDFTESELSKAEVILTTLEQSGMQPPNITKAPDTWFRSTGDYGYEAAEWEPENE